MKDIFRSQKGLTLIEVLTSMVILSIILISFFSYFINAAKYNANTSDKLKTTNIARDIQEEFKVNDGIKADMKNLLAQYNDSIESYPMTLFPNLNLKQDIIETQSGDLQLTLNDPNYTINVYLTPDPVSNLTTSLHKLHVQVEKDGKVLSETYTYVHY